MVKTMICNINQIGIHHDGLLQRLFLPGKSANVFSEDEWCSSTISGIYHIKTLSVVDARWYVVFYEMTLVPGIFLTVIKIFNETVFQKPGPND